MKRNLRTFTFGATKIQGRDIYDAYYKLKVQENWWAFPPTPNKWKKFAKRDCNRRFRRSKSVHRRELKICSKGWVGTYLGKVYWD